MWSINGLDYEVKKEDLAKVAIDVCTQLNYDIPRFCYHENLKIAGNCRMCLIEDSKAPKPIICCAMSVAPNLSIFTNTLRVKKARESVMEFLLINHPLDCPICDQGGECDLQELALVYGSDHGRFYEYKRSVEDKNCGSIIKTIMNRCILCTRCVRFSLDVSNFSTFGTTGRGSKMEIGSYIEKSLLSELSGNLVDICPVGALTSKPYAFLARPWELKKITVLNIFDDYIQQIRADVKENKLIRITPSKNNLYLNTWITNKVRFSYEGLQRSRLLSIFVNNVEISWSKFLNSFSFIFLSVLKSVSLLNVPFLFSNMQDFVDLKLITTVQKFTQLNGSSYVVSKKNNSSNAHCISYYNNFSSLDTTFIYAGLNSTYDTPINNISYNLLDSQEVTLINWLSILDFKKFDIICLDFSMFSIKNFILGKHWASSFANNLSVLFYNFIFFWFSNFSNFFSTTPIFYLGASYRNLNVLNSVSTHSQNLKNLSYLSSFSINTSTQYNTLLSTTQSSHKFKDLFVLPSQALYEQGVAEFYSSSYSKVQTTRAITTGTMVKSNSNIINAISNLLGNKVVNDSTFNYEQEGSNTRLNFFNKSLFSFIYIFTNYIFLPSSKLLYLTDNLLSINSITTTSTLRNENILNIY